jgi:hypothetical protein
MIRGEIMVNNNLNINLNSTVPLNSINHKSNQYWESFPKEFDKIQPKMLQQDGVVMVKMKVLVMRMMVMMIPMKSGTMMMTMEMISPLWEGISPADFCLGVKTERIRTDSSETVFVTIFFSDLESEQIVCRYEYGIGVYR